MLSFDNIVIVTRATAIAFEGLTDDEEVLAYLPMAWIGEHIFSYAAGLLRRVLRLLPGIAAPR